MKKILHIVFVLCTGLFATDLAAQQVEQMSQYFLNDYVINPAVAGNRYRFDVRLLNRSQWAGVQDAPRTTTLSLYGPSRNPKISYGGYIFADHAGPTRRTGIQASGGYKFYVRQNMFMSLSLSFGATQFTIDGTQIVTAQGGDPALFSDLNNNLKFDAKFGALIFGEQYYFGITLPQLLQNRLDFSENGLSENMSRLEDHYMIIGAYKFKLNDSFVIEPNLLVKYVNPAPFKIDAGFRAIYKEMVWVGAGWRNNDAYTMNIGYEWKKNLMIGYSYDYVTSRIADYSDGSHEIMIGFRFDQ